MTPVINLKSLGIVLMAFGALASPREAQAQRYINPNDPIDYLSKTDVAVQDFWKRYGYYPQYWFDIQLNCRKLKQPVCKLESQRPRRARKSMTPDGSQFRYEIVEASRSRYRIVAIDKRGCAKFYIDQRHRALKVESACRPRKGN